MHTCRTTVLAVTHQAVSILVAKKKPFYPCQQKTAAAKPIGISPNKGDCDAIAPLLHPYVVFQINTSTAITTTFTSQTESLSF